MSIYNSVSKHGVMTCVDHVEILTRKLRIAIKEATILKQRIAEQDLRLTILQDAVTDLRREIKRDEN